MPTAVCVEVGAALAAAATELRHDPQALARLLETSREALRATLEGAGNPGIHVALDHIEGASRILAPHVRVTTDAAGSGSVVMLLRELHQVLADLHVRLFMDASTRLQLAPLIQLIRDDVSILRQQIGGSGKPGDPCSTTRRLVRIQAELAAVQILDSRSGRALMEARNLLSEILDVTGGAPDAGLAPDVHGRA